MIGGDRSVCLIALSHTWVRQRRQARRLHRSNGYSFHL